MRHASTEAIEQTWARKKYAAQLLIACLTAGPRFLWIAAAARFCDGLDSTNSHGLALAARRTPH